MLPSQFSNWPSPSNFWSQNQTKETKLMNQVKSLASNPKMQKMAARQKLTIQTLT